MNKTLRNLVGGIALTTTTACASLSGALPERIGQMSFHPVMEVCVEGMPVRISHNANESWRIIRIESPDGRYVEAEKEINDRDSTRLFTTLTFDGIELNHPLKKYHNFHTLEEIYTGIRQGRITKCS